MRERDRWSEMREKESRYRQSDMREKEREKEV